MDDPNSLISLYLRAFSSGADRLRGLTDLVVADAYFAKVYAVSLKRAIRALVLAYDDPDKKSQVRKVYFSTDLTLLGEDIYWVYRSRFQIEFIYYEKLLIISTSG